MREDLTSALAKVEKDMENLPAEQMAFAKLLRTKEISEEQVQFFTKSLKTVQLMQNVPSGALDLYQVSEKAKPLKDAWWVNLLPILGLLFGLLSGLVLAIYLEMQEHKN